MAKYLVFGYFVGRPIDDTGSLKLQTTDREEAIACAQELLSRGYMRYHEAIVERWEPGDEPGVQMREVIWRGGLHTHALPWVDPLDEDVYEEEHNL